ncbi:HAMP domain-containing sensor histidine kinase [Adlercreutzia agrestimuris]|uniref:HAMP domain-containing sensor histidine kinase n=1 Tax=Adlercreutzia agrestimuris TaxID=2941324 RepID=UPI002041F5DF|nr:HAMP domain-containing sensor histidine kinase [Adlercreutzia agrestimuris]
MARQGEQLTKRLVWVSVLAALAVAITAMVSMFLVADGDDGTLRNQVVELNDVREGLAENANEGQVDLTIQADQALESAQITLRNATETQNTTSAFAIALIAFIAIVTILSLVIYLYHAIARPFTKLEGFAEEVASGNLEAPLVYERSNPFGKFAWAFDHLRKELERARKDEECLREDHKTALASLSHDLRTPLASLRAYAETLEMSLVDSEAEREEYERAIIRKCDEVSSLVEDLFQHALTDMDRISVECESIQAAHLVRRCANDASGLALVSCGSIDEALVMADESRLAQVIDNLIGNSIKYAEGARIEVSAAVENRIYTISVRDFGPGIPAEDMPFATDRFYRGSNASGKSGSGLGLFISAYLVERMGGKLHLENARPGLEATIELPSLH